MKKSLWLALSLFASSVACASNHNGASVNLMLNSLSVQSTQEKSGDELYFTVTTYPTKGRPAHKEVPRFPHYWISSHLDKIKNLKLWSGDLAKGQGTTIMLALIERDTPPWDTDDLIGHVEITIKNINGKLNASWKIPNTETKPDSHSVGKRLEKSFVFTDDKGAKYTANLSLNG